MKTRAGWISLRPGHPQILTAWQHQFSHLATASRRAHGRMLPLTVAIEVAFQKIILILKTNQERHIVMPVPTLFLLPKLYHD